MDDDELKEEIEHQRTLQKEYCKRLGILEQQAAMFGIYVPHIQIEINELRDNIYKCDQEIIEHKNELIIPINRRTSIFKNTINHLKEWQRFTNIYRNSEIDPLLHALRVELHLSIEEHALIDRILKMYVRKKSRYTSEYDAIRTIEHIENEIYLGKRKISEIENL
jgi:hypothetical protein